MLLEILIAILIGCILGTFSGIFPGLHINTINAMILASSLFLSQYVSLLTLAIIIISDD